MPAIEEVYAQIAEFAQGRGARRVYLYGSRARGDALPKSDIDLAVEGCADFSGLYEDLQERLWSLLCIDAVNLDDHLSDSLRGQIERDGKVIYEAL